ncbi:MAG: hypothetical protein CVV49_19135 [Spirochaetae bacterium HGW-Spirochaetae-5]|nr:MAG: hypothetical protein CVV49_19135 [Spirochaetae bacterium HGW-Spirochaetae-5]
MKIENDKRRHERMDIKQVLELSTSEGAVINAQGVNISESGLLCRTDMEIPAGTFIMFKLLIPSGKSEMLIPCEGIVLKCSEKNGKFDVVIDFTDSDSC